MRLEGKDKFVAYEGSFCIRYNQRDQVLGDQTGSGVASIMHEHSAMDSHTQSLKCRGDCPKYVDHKDM